MSPEAQRIAIAESVGIYLHDGDHAPSNYTFVSDLPDYLNDLNAMHEAEKELDIRKVEIYCAFLVRIVRHSLGIEDHESIYPLRFAVYSIAAQRAEAYLRTIGKWEGEDER